MGLGSNFLEFFHEPKTDFNQNASPTGSCLLKHLRAKNACEPCAQHLRKLRLDALHLNGETHQGLSEVPQGRDKVATRLRASITSGSSSVRFVARKARYDSAAAGLFCASCARAFQ
jgi:hypothetical protein